MSAALTPQQRALIAGLSPPLLLLAVSRAPCPVFAAECAAELDRRHEPPDCKRPPRAARRTPHV